jgi:dTMP kinase
MADVQQGAPAESGRKGLFITFESIDGLGKTTQVELLTKRLVDLGDDLYITKEPGDAKAGSNLGGGIRQIVFGYPSTKNLRPGVADLLFLADHVQNAGDVADALAQGKTVISDRYADSQFAYAASQSKQAPPWALDLYAQHFGVVPDITLLLVARGERYRTFDPEYPQMPFEEIGWALKRANARRGVEAGKQDGKAWNDVDQQRKIQNAYIRNLASEPRTRVIPVWEGDSVEVVADKIWEAVRWTVEYRAVFGGPVPNAAQSDFVAHQ